MGTGQAIIRPRDVDLSPERERIHPKLLRQLVDGLLQGEDALDLTGRPEGGAGSGVGEDVVLLHLHVRAVVERGVAEADARAAGHTAAAVGLELEATSVPSRLAPSLSRWMLFGRFPPDTCSSRRSSIIRTGARALRERWMASSP